MTFYYITILLKLCSINNISYNNYIDNSAYEKQIISITKTNCTMLSLLKHLGLWHKNYKFEGSIRFNTLRLHFSDKLIICFKCDPDSLIMNVDCIDRILNNGDLKDLLQPFPLKASDVKVKLMWIEKLE